MKRILLIVILLGLFDYGAAYNAPETEDFEGPYATALDNFHPTAPDAGIAGFTGPNGRGVCPAGENDDQSSGDDPNNIINPVFSGWASHVVSYEPFNLAAIQNYLGGIFSLPEKSLGPVTGDNFDIVSLGDMDVTDIADGNSPGMITLAFDEPIQNGPGPDFAVFENGFVSAGGAGVYGQIFAELAYVEVSTDGIHFVRFPCVSLTEGDVGSYGTIDPTQVYNLAGKHVNAYEESWGTPFNLKDITADPDVINGTVDPNEINYVRIVDIPGNGYFQDTATDLIDPATIDPNSGLGGTYYTQNHGIHDAWVTWGSGGHDLEAIGAIDQIYGDADSNGKVDFFDFLRIARRWNRPGNWPQGDFNEDGFVDVMDLILFGQNWLYECPSRYWN